MILKMSRVSIIGPQRLIPEVMACIYEAGVLHIESLPEGLKTAPYVRKVTLSPELVNEIAELERVLGITKKTMNAIMPLFIKPPTVEHVDREPTVTDAMRRVEEISISVDELTQEIRKLEHELSVFIRYEKILTALAPLIEIMPESPFRDYTGITLYKREAALPLLENALNSITAGRYDIFTKDIDEETTACIIVYPKEFYHQIKRILQEENISELRMPADLAEMPVTESLRIILDKRAGLPPMIDDLDMKLRRLAHEIYPELLISHRIIKDRLRQIEVSSDLYGTRNTFLLCGWIPKDRKISFTDTVRNRFGEMIIIQHSEPLHAEVEKIPVLLSNPKLIKHFEVLTRFLGIPKYGTFDPTPMLAIFFPLFFGFILGDMGYGAILFFASLWAGWRWRDSATVRDLSRIFMAGALLAILFGFIFGEFFGNLPESIGIHPRFDRKKALIPLLIVSVVIGVIHISLGLIIGVIISFKRRETGESISRLLKLLFVFLLFTAMVSIYGLLPEGSLEVLLIMGIADILALSFIEKWFAPVDALKLVVNILSYARIMGFAAASIFLASIANRLTAMPRNIFLGILIGIFFHLINIVIGVYAPAIQTLRLHYVEFFDKFFYPGGIEYRPFGREERW